jgi:hypothetical protein
MAAKKNKAMVACELRMRAYPVMCRAVEEGIDYGWMRAHKHTDKPSEQAIKDEIHAGIMNAICEMFDFDVDPGAQ